MFKLMKLEWKKNNLAGYVTKAVISTVIIFAIAAGMALMSQAHNEPMFPDFTAFMSLANIFIRSTFVVFSGIIISRLVIEEYRSGTIQLLFSYPLQRKKVIQAKLMIVFGFCFSSIVVATLIIEGLTILLNPSMKFFETPVSIRELWGTIPSIFIASVMTAGLSLIPLSFGMRKKSTATTIISSIIIGVLLNATVSDGRGSVSLYEFVGVPIAFCVFGLVVAYLSYRKMDRIDVA